MKTFRIWLFFALTLAFSTLASTECKLYFAPNTGRIVTQFPRELPVPEGAEVYFMGEGIAGGKVFRVEAPHVSSKIYKVYRSELVMSMDMDRFDIIHDVLKDEPAAPFRSVTMKRAEGDGKSIAEVTPVWGESVARILKNPDVPEEAKSQIRALYEERFQRFLKLIETKRPGSRLITTVTSHEHLI